MAKAEPGDHPAELGASARIAAWLTCEAIGVLNVAGPSESRAAGIGALAEEVLLAAFEALAVT